MPREPLPIDDVLPQVVAALRENSSVVLRAPTGAGKTTRVPPALLDGGLLGERRVIVLEPRRVAARAAARRMAFERQCSLGEEVGYQVRFDRKWNERTRVLVVTEGTLVRMLQDDPFLEDIAALVFDEFHERSLDTDLSLGMVRRVQQTVRPDLKIVVMSATLGVEAVSRFLGDCPIVVSEGRLFPVEISYVPRSESTPLAVAVARAVEQLLRAKGSGVFFRAAETPTDIGSSRAADRKKTPDPVECENGLSGDVLVFLPGQREIREVARELESLARQHDLLVMPLHGELSPEQQDAALSRQPKRKVVLATNVAETSVTVDGVTAVVDSGLSRQLRFDPNSGLDRLELGPISRASAEQRAGRAGRQQLGVCVRLWSEASQRARPEHTEPEIRRVDLAGPVLQLLAWGESDVLAFPWFELPRENSVRQAEALLQRLGAIVGPRSQCPNPNVQIPMPFGQASAVATRQITTDAGSVGERASVSSLGQTLARLPVHPRLGRLLIEGARLEQPDRAALAAALLAERDPFENLSTGHRTGAASPSDVLDRLEALEEFAQTGRETTAFGRLNRGAAQYLLQTRDQLRRLVRRDTNVEESLRDSNSELRSNLATERDTALMRALIAAFPDRLAKRREPNSPRALMVGGYGVRLSSQSRVTQSELFVCLDVDAGSGVGKPALGQSGLQLSSGEAVVRIASAVEREWLPPELVTVATEVYFDEAAERVQARRQVRWEDLVLEESPAALPQDDSVARMLAEGALRNWERIHPADDSPASRFVTRVRCLRDWLPELNFPAFDEAQWQSLLPVLCVGRRSLAELKEASWLEAVHAELTATQWQAVEREAPERILVPSGSRIALQYEAGRPPVLAVRIQEIFGWRETPRIARGRVRVLLHLLAPSHRPQQITDDLVSFWANAYPQIRSELRRRYPKHAWPDNPLTAVAAQKG